MGVTEEEFLRALAVVTRMLAKSLSFGYFSPEDIAQEAAVYGWLALARYDPGEVRADGTVSRPLENFLYRHIKFRLLNLKRQLYRRTDAPCPLCRNGQEYYHDDHRVCAAHRAWEERNGRKASLCSPRRLDSVPEELGPLSSDIVSDVALRELWSLVDEELSPELRADYLRIRAGERVSKIRRLRVLRALEEILGQAEEGSSDVCGAGED